MTAPLFPNSYEREQAAAHLAAARTKSPVVADPATPEPPRTPLADLLTGTIRPPVPSPPPFRPGMATQPDDPIREQALTRLEVLGLAYAPNLTPLQSQSIARRLYDWSGGDPDLNRMIDEDFAGAAEMSQTQWFGRSDTILAKAWWEAFGVIQAVSGKVAGDDRAVDLERRDRLAEAAGPDATVARLLEMSAQEREEYAWDQATQDGVISGLSGGDPMGGAFRALFREEAIEQANLLSSAEIRSQIDRRAAVEANPQLAMGLLAQHLLASGNVKTMGVAVDEAITLFDALSDEERNRLIVEVREARTEDLVAAFESSVTEETPVSKVARITLEATMEKLATWDAVAHTVGIQVLDEIQTMRALSGDPDSRDRVTPIDVWRAEGFDAFQASFDEVKQSGLAGFYGYEQDDAAFGWINIGASMFFDPLNWVTLSGASQAKMGANWMKSGAGADAMLASRRGRDLVKGITSTDDALRLAPMLHGMSSNARRILLDATDPAVVEDVIRNETANGTWLMNGPALAMRHQSYLGAGQIGASLNDTNVVGEKVGHWLTEMLRRQDHTRQVSIDNVGFLDDASEAIVARFATDPDRARETLRSVYDTWDDYAAGGLEQSARRVTQAQELRREAVALWRGTNLPTRRVGKARTALTEARAEKLRVDGRMVELTEEMNRATGVAVGNAVDDTAQSARSVNDILAEAAELDGVGKTLTERIEGLEWHTTKYGDDYDKVFAERSRLRRESARLSRANEAAMIPRSKTGLVQWWDGFMDEWATEVGIPRSPDGKPMWSEVRGKGSRAGTQDDAGRLAPFGSMQAAAEAVGLGQTGSRHWLPVSPYEMAVYRGARDAGNLDGLRKVYEGAWKGVGVVARAANRVWAANLLFNPLNAAKAHIEDVIKFKVAGAPTRQALRALVGAGTDSTRGREFLRQTMLGFEKRRPPWTTVDRGSRGHFEASKRWLEGTVIQDETIRTWAQAVLNDDPTIWWDWWDEVGQFRANAPVVSPPGEKAVMLTRDTAYDVMSRSVDVLAAGSSDPAAFRRMLIEAAGTGKREVPARMANMAGSVPTEATQMGKVTSAAMNMYYGAPARARGGVFFDHYYEQAMDVYEARWAGRIIDDRLDELVQAGFAPSTTDAEVLIALRDPAVDDYLRSAGLITRGRLEQEAAEWAGRHAQSLMYLSGASSIAGQEFATAAPFAPAQFDFLRWWTRQMHAGTDFVLNAGTVALTGAEPVVAHLPSFNVRLASKYTHLAAESGRRDENTPAFHPISLIERFTFLPVALDDPDNFINDFLPGLGPVPTWLLHLLPDDNKFRDAAEAAIPSLTWVKGQADTPAGILRHLLPATTRSVTGTTGWLMRGAAANTDSERLDRWLEDELAGGVFDLARRPIGSTDILKYNLGAALATNPNLTPGVDDQQIAAIINESMDQANNREAVNRFKMYVGMQTRFGADNMVIGHYGPLVDAIPGWAEAGVVGQAQADQLTGLWAAIQSGDATPEQRRLFGDAAAAALFDLPDDLRDRLVAENPALAVNLVSTIQCRLDSTGQPVGPEGYCRPDGRVDTNNPDLQGSNGAEVRRKGFEQGWFEPRPESDVALDVIYAFNQARSRSTRALWEAVTGQPYAQRLTKKFTGATVTLSEGAIVAARRLGFGLDESMSGQELRAAFSNALASYPQDKISVADNPLFQRLRQNPEYGQLLDVINQIEDRLAEDDIGITSMYDWHETTKEVVRGLFAELAVTDPSIRTGYDNYLRSALGPLEYDPPTPPAESALQNRIRLGPSDVSVVDGDTITLHAADGDIRVRIIGLNAPEQGQDGYVQAWEQLEAVIEAAGSVTVGQYRPDLFGATQEVDAGQTRLFGWLYLDGVPLYDASVFTSTNPTGARTGGIAIDYAALLRTNAGGD